MTNYLLCVLAVQLAYLTGEIAGKTSDKEVKASKGATVLLSIIASLLLGLILYVAILYAVDFLTQLAREQ